MIDNWYALLICILKPVTVEKAFDLFEGIFPKVNNTAVTQDDVEDMIKLKNEGLTYRELGEIYGMSKDAVHKRIKGGCMGSQRNWTPEEKTYLSDNWGTLSMSTLMAKLNRSRNAILVMARRLSLGPFLEGGEYVTFNQLLKTLGYGGGSGYLMKSWVKDRGFPLKYKRVDQNRFKVVYIDDFWEWAERNQDLLDFSKFEENALGKEPDWVKVKRKNDFQHRLKIKTDPWTPAEDEKLKRLLKQQKYTYLELSKILGRTSGAIQRRCCDLKIKDRPVKADNHVEWTNEELQLLTNMIKQGYRYPAMSMELGKSDKAIRGLVFRYYLTERLDRVREYIGTGNFGDNRPPRTIGQYNLMTIEEKNEVKDLLTRLVAILRFEYKQFFDGSDFWQKDLCQHWEGYCTKCQTDCDSCTEFERIRPQYCKRCGGTFYERRKELICRRCREQRVKQYLRKKAVLNKGVVA